MSDEFKRHVGDSIPPRVLDDYAPPPPRTDLVGGIMEAIANESVPSKSSDSHELRGKPYLFAAAAVILLSLVSAAVWLGRPATQGGTIEATENRTADLGDRARADMQAGAHIDYRIQPAFLVFDETADVNQPRGAVRYTVRRAGPFVVTTPGARVHVTGTEFLVEVRKMNPKTTKKLIGAGLVTVVTVYAGSVLLENDHGSVALAVGDRAQAVSSLAPEPIDENASVDRDQNSPADENNSSKFRRLENAQAREKLISAIQAARQIRARLEDGKRAAETREESDDEDGLRASLTKDTIRDAVEAVIGDVKICYEEQLKLTPELGGKMVVHFVINAEEGVGGFVEEVSLTDESDEAMRTEEELYECIFDSIYTLEFPKPEGAGTVEVNYPIYLAPAKDGMPPRMRVD